MLIAGWGKEIKRKKILMIWLGICLVIIACESPFYIQSADAFLATAVDKTVEALVGQNPVGEISVTATVIPPHDNDPLYDFTPTPKLFGVDKKFMIQRVQSGDNLSQYARQYDTTEGAIIRVNYSLNLPLWEDTMVVIPVGFSNVAQMPYFQPYMVTAGDITVEDLALELGTSLDALIYYNGLYKGKQLNVGDWLIIPRMAPGY